MEELMQEKKEKARVKLKLCSVFLAVGVVMLIVGVVLLLQGESVWMSFASVLVTTAVFISHIIKLLHILNGK